MRFPSALAFALMGGTISLPRAHGWGTEGHEIVATIAQMFLQPRTLSNICDILDLPRCHLAPISTWADQNRDRMPWSAPMHYINALDDHPADHCVFPGSRGWDGAKNVNVLDAVKNTTSLLQSWVEGETGDGVANEALKFLVHFVGDMHQPLHLTGRDKGGNLVKVNFGTKQTNLHTLWDSVLLDKLIALTPKNYSKPLPNNPTVEAALRGKAYDPYIRRIMWESVLSGARAFDVLKDWTTCRPSAPSDNDPHGLKYLDGNSGILGLWRSMYGATVKVVQYLFKDGVEINPDGPVVCPYFWAQSTHQLNCDIVWPKALGLQAAVDTQDQFATLNLDTPEYAGIIEKRMIVEKLLAQAGVRLASVLNFALGDAGVEEMELSWGDA